MRSLVLVDVLSLVLVSLHLEDERAPVGEQVLGDGLHRAERDGGRVDDTGCREDADDAYLVRVRVRSGSGLGLGVGSGLGLGVGLGYTLEG